MSESSAKDKRLYDAIREIVDNQGKSIIEDVRFVNILDDVMSFESIPAVKPILKDLIKNGYGRKILDIDKSKESYILKEQSLIVTIVKNRGYKIELVRYILDCVSYGLHWTNSVPSSFISYQNENGKHNILENLKDELAQLKKEYTSFLKSAITVPDNSAGYFTASALTEINYLADKIRILANILDTDDYKWCINEKRRILDEYYLPSETNKKGNSIFYRLFGIKNQK